MVKCNSKGNYVCGTADAEGRRDCDYVGAPFGSTPEPAVEDDRIAFQRMTRKEKMIFWAFSGLFCLGAIGFLSAGACGGEQEDSEGFRVRPETAGKLRTVKVHPATVKVYPAAVSIADDHYDHKSLSQQVTEKPDHDQRAVIAFYDDQKKSNVDEEAVQVVEKSSELQTQLAQSMQRDRQLHGQQAPRSPVVTNAPATSTIAARALHEANDDHHEDAKQHIEHAASIASQQEARLKKADEDAIKVANQKLETRIARRNSKLQELQSVTQKQ